MDNPELEMASRVQRYLITGFGAIVVGGLAIAATWKLGQLAFGDVPKWFAAVPIALFVVVFVVCVRAMLTLRCPSCEKLVAFQVAAHMSLFARAARPTCPHCGTPIFGAFARRFRPMIWMSAAIAVSAMIAATVMLRRH